MDSSRELSPSASGPKCAAVDLSKIRPGDEITIRATVTEAQRGNECWPVRATIDGISNIAGMFAGEFCFSPSAVAAHTPKPLAVGDLVRDTAWQHADEEPWVLLYRDDSQLVLVGRGNHTRGVKSLSQLERAR